MFNYKKILLTIVLVCLLCVPFFSFVRADIQYSEMELRKKVTKPENNIDKFLSGQYFDEMEKYYLDHMFIRDNVVNFKAQFEKKIGVKQRNGVIMGNEGHLLPVNTPIGSKDFLESKQEEINEIIGNIVSLKELADDQGVELIKLSGFEKSSVYSDLYPFFSPSNIDGMSEYLDVIARGLKANGISTIDMSNKLKNNYPESYYKTDHHYNIYGTLLTYNTILDYLNNFTEYTFDAVAIDDLNLYEPSGLFIGSYARLLGDKSYFSIDKQVLPDLSIFPNFERFESGIKSEVPIISDSANFSYGNFMSGDKANTVIKTYRKELPNILFIGDSFTNSLELLSIRQFNEVHSLDQRHFKGSVTNYIRENDIDIIVLVNNSLFTNKYIKEK